MPPSALLAASMVAALAACSRSDKTSANPPASAPPTVEPAPTPTFDKGGRVCTGKTRSSAPDEADTPAVPAGITVAQGLTIEAIARVPSARQIAALPNGDLLVATMGTKVYLVPHADAAKAGTPTVFSTIDDAPVHSVTFHEPSCHVFIGSQRGVYRATYEDAQETAPSGEPIARVRAEGGGGHTTTSVAVAGAYLYAGVGSYCNACVETDPTRATVQRMNIDGSGMTTYAKRIRNPIALATNPNTGTLWAGNAGQDALPEGHPYELFDAVTAHPLGVDYGWPDCEENQKAYTPGADCSGVVAPRVVLPAYSTLISAAFYPASPTGENALPARYHGGAFVVARGAWHKISGDMFFSSPRVVFVPMKGDDPVRPVDWNDPSTQWTEIVTGFETPDRKTRIGRAAGVAVGPDGSLFVSDDEQGLVFRVRPAR